MLLRSLRHVLAMTVVVSCLSGVANASLFVIDDFTAPSGSGAPQVAQTSGINPSWQRSQLGGLPPANAFGGVRELWAKKISGTNSLANRVRVTAGNGLASFTQGSDAEGQGLMRWDGFVGGPLTSNSGATPGTSFSSPGIGDLDITNGGTNSDLVFQNWVVTSASTSGPKMTISINTSSGIYQYSEITQTTTATTHFIPLASFLAPSGAFSQVRGIEIYFDGQSVNGGYPGSGVEFTLFGTISGGTTAVPEPGTAALTLMGALSALVWYRKRR